ncbi:MAG TPA: head-tail adaptor protein [Sedimentisphaerales bacterium]|nr:head-tail adaptor protein [Sedimentisphaerales bacterium]
MSDYRIQIGDTSIEATNVANSVDMYNLSCDIVRMTRTNTALGVSDTPPVVIVTAMPCDIKFLGGKESIKFNKETYCLDAVLRCRKPAGVTIVNTDKVDYNGEYYEITNILDINNLGVLLEITLRRVK